MNPFLIYCIKGPLFERQLRYGSQGSLTIFEWHDHVRILTIAIADAAIMDQTDHAAGCFGCGDKRNNYIDYAGGQINHIIDLTSLNIEVLWLSPHRV